MSEMAASASDVLTQREAEERAARISNTSYDLEIELERGSGTYRGEVTITFDVAGEGATFLDFRGTEIEAFEVNGRPLTPEWRDCRLVVPAEALAPETRVRIRYVNDYDHGGDGFHQFVDPEDGEEYVYTTFEPYFAHRLFPCFDQPDIKARYRLAVTAPGEWQVIANSAADSTADAGDGRTRHVFPETKPFSTYLFALIAGPYEVVRSEHGGIPLGLFVRRSLAPYLDAEELFEVSRQGLDFFAEFFDYPYPFGKYDQIFVPEFNGGAMENVGAVTHNEYMVFRDPPTENQRRRRAEIVLHEMAHMWFGNLVTMRWWNDLWLNEAFATYMAYLAMEQATRFGGAWQDFNAAIKTWAYRQDQLVTTHPISGVVADTDETFLNFDGITYGKGASVLRQLVAAIGEEGFRAGMRHYFRKHEYGNATLRQFLESLEAGSAQPLQEWARLWLETSSVNTIAATLETDGDRISRLALGQTAPAEYPVTRPHTLEVGLVRDGGEALEVTVLPAKLDGAEVEVEGAVGLPRPDLVFPNYGDLAYAKAALDADSTGWVRANIERVDDDLLRQLLWSSLWSMVRDQQLSSLEFLTTVREKAPGEPLTELLDPILTQASAAVARFVPEERIQEEAHLLFQTAWEGLREAGSQDARIIWARTLITSAVTPEDIEFTGRLADGLEVVPGFEVDQQMRWDIAVRSAAHGLPGAMGRVAAEAERDPSDRGTRARLKAESSAPSPAVKAAAWERIHGEGYGTLKMTTAAMSGFNWRHQKAILEPFVERFFAGVADVFRTGDTQFRADYFSNLFPGYRVDRGTLEQSQRLLADVAGKDVTLERMLREANDELERAIRCREFAARA